MGEDIHMKWYVKSKVGNKTGRYVSAMEVMWSFDTSSSDDFANLFQFRSYDFFSMLGSRRGEWRKLKNLNEGFPSWHATEFPTENAFLKLRGNNYYSFSWITFKDLVFSLKDRVRQLNDVRTYYSEDSDKEFAKSILELLDIDGNSKEAKTFVKRFKEEGTALSKICLETLEKLIDIKNNYDDEEIREIFDIEDSVIMFWFDS